MNALRVLAAMFDIDTGKATENLKKLDTGISTAKGALQTLAASVVGAFSIGAFSHFIEQQIELGSKINDTAEKLGVTTEQLQKFQFAAGLAGVSSDGAATALQFLNKNLGEAIGGGAEQAKTFAEMGISLEDVKNGSKGAADLLPDIAKKFEALGSDAERTKLAMSLFGKSGAQLIPLLKQGSAELAKLDEEFYALGGGLQEDFIKAADQAGDEVDKLKFAFTSLKSRIAISVFPALTDFVKHLQKMAVFAIKLTKETHIVKEGLAILGAIGAAAGVKVAIGWAKFFGLFPTGNVGIMKTLASLGWFGLVIAVVAGLALVFEDLFVGIQGGQSVIRDWLNEMIGVEETKQLFDQLKLVVDQIADSFKGMSPSVGALLKMLAEMAVSPTFVATIEFIVRMLGSMVALLVAAARAAGNIVTGDLAGAGKAIDQGGDAVFGKNGFFGENAFKPYAATPGKVREPTSFGRGDVNVQGGDTTITVNGAGDPNAVANRVAGFQKNVATADLQQAAAALRVGAPE